MIKKVLVANRGEIAMRIIRACHERDIEAVLVVSEADRYSLPAQIADRSVCIGPAAARHSYLDVSAILATAHGTGVDAVHPGYGFLSENSNFARLCEEHQLVFIGPRSDSIASMGNKSSAREIARTCGVPIAPGSSKLGSVVEARKAASEIGFPLLLKASAGGGGRGIRIVTSDAELASSFHAASAEAQASFGDGSLYAERYIESAQHLEVQVLGDEAGTVLHVGDRDCTLQRRHQKIIEEADGLGPTDELRDGIRRAAVELAEHIGYQNAGTVEFIVDRSTGEWYFLEMNTRIQVEHPVTEMISGLDLIGLQLEVASGIPLSLSQRSISLSGVAIEARVNAEAPGEAFRPSPGLLTRWDPPRFRNARLDTHCYQGYYVPPYYDSLVAKLITWGGDRSQAIASMREALRQFTIGGIDTNIDLLIRICDDPDYEAKAVDTKWIDRKLPLLLQPAR